MTHTHAAAQEPEVITAEVIAKTLAGIHLIGYARRALEQAGWATRLHSNRITVNGAVEALLLSSNGHGWWQVYAADGTPPVWTVGTRHDQAASCWIGCVE